jgi:hypothetical protein
MPDQATEPGIVADRRLGADGHGGDAAEGDEQQESLHRVDLACNHTLSFLFAFATIVVQMCRVTVAPSDAPTETATNGNDPQG